MGSASSILPPDLEKDLSDESLEAFYELHRECEGMSPDLQCEILTKKYKELVEIDSRTHKNGKSAQGVHRRGSKQHDASEIDQHVPHQTSPQTYRKKKPEEPEHHWVPTELKESELMDEEKMSYEMQMVMDEVSDLHLGDFDQTYTTDLVTKVFNGDRYERLTHPKSRDEKHAEQEQLHHHDHAHHDGPHSATHSPRLAHPPHHSTHNTHHNKHDTHSHGPEHEDVHDITYECHICTMFFDSESTLDFHTHYSDLHKKNLHLREKRLEAAHKEAIRLTGLAKKVMATLYHTLPVVAEKTRKRHTPAPAAAPGDGYDAVLAQINAQETHHAEVQARWKSALNKVLHRNLTHKFARILETRINVPTGVEMIYEGSKYFFRTKTTYDLRFLQHESHRVFEIIPTFVPFNHETGQLESLETSAYIPAKRIYLNYDVLLKSFFGYNIVTAELTSGPTNLGSAPHMEHLKGSLVVFCLCVYSLVGILPSLWLSKLT